MKKFLISFLLTLPTVADQQVKPIVESKSFNTGCAQEPVLPTRVGLEKADLVFTAEVLHVGRVSDVAGRMERSLTTLRKAGAIKGDVPTYIKVYGEYGRCDTKKDARFVEEHKFLVFVYKESADDTWLRKTDEGRIGFPTNKEVINRAWVLLGTEDLASPTAKQRLRELKFLKAIRNPDKMSAGTKKK